MNTQAGEVKRLACNAQRASIHPRGRKRELLGRCCFALRALLSRRSHVRFYCPFNRNTQAGERKRLACNAERRMCGAATRETHLRRRRLSCFFVKKLVRSSSPLKLTCRIREEASVQRARGMHVRRRNARKRSYAGCCFALRFSWQEKLARFYSPCTIHKTARPCYPLSSTEPKASIRP